MIPETDFIIKVTKHKPTFWLRYKRDIGLLGQEIITIYCGDPVISAPTDIGKYADYIWSSGQVIKDFDGLFSSPTTVNTTATTTTTATQYVNFTSPILKEANHSIDTNVFTKRKCECGAHKTNSTKHSDWCDLKDGE